MDIIVANVGAFMELLMIEFYYGLIWGEPIALRAFGVFIAVWNAIMVTCANMNLLPGFVILSSYIWFIIYTHFHYSGKIKENIVKFVVLIIVAAMTEMVTLTIVNLIKMNLHITRVGYLVTCLLNLLFAVILSYIGRKRKIFHGFKGIYNKVFLILVLMTFIGGYIFVDICMFQKLRIGYYLLLFVLFAFIVIYIIKFQKANYILLQKNLEEKINKFYGNVYEELLHDVRRRQHDYKNHLIAIYNSHQKADSMEELISIQSDYLNDIIEEGRFDSILTKCNDPVVAGFLYHKACYCDDNNIEFEFDLSFSGINCAIKKYELIEILGNFIDNAIEYVIARKNRIIKVKLLENAYDLTVSISNPSEFLEQKRIKEIFNFGNSSKGDGRGIGLSRVHQICENNNLDIQVENVMEKENWIKFTVIIPNREGDL